MPLLRARPRPALGCELRRANLVDMCQDSYHCPTLQTGLPGVYIINASSIAKPHALDKLNAELSRYQLDIAIITETHLKKHHCASTASSQWTDTKSSGGIEWVG